MALKASEELLAAPLPKMIQALGLAVANANKELAEEDMVYAINEAVIELNVAITIDSSEEIGAGLGFDIKAFNVNASYAKTFGFKEEASSRIKLTLNATNREKKATTGSGSQNATHPAGSPQTE